MDSSLKNQKFGVVHTSPAEMLTKTLEVGKLYFAQGDASGAAKQGIYALTNSSDVDGVNELTMFGTGAIADGNGYGLSQANFTTDEKNKLGGIAENANNYSLPLAEGNTRGGIQVGFTAKDASIPVQLSGEDAYVQLTKTSIEKGLGYTIAASVPSDAKFTDTDTWRVIKINGAEEINSSTSTALDISAGKNIEVSFANNKVVIAANEVDASNADHATNADNASTADKVKSSLTIKGNGITAGTFNGSDAEEVNIKSGDVQILTVSGTADGSITITPKTAAVTANSSALTTGAHVATYVSSELGKLSGALIYKDTITSYSDLPTASTSNTGHVYICSSTFTTTAAQTGVEYRIEVGDMFISNGSKWNIVSSEFDVSTYDTTLSWGTDVSIAVVDGVTIKATLPANPNTDYQATKAGHYTPSDKDASVVATANGTVAWSGAVVTGVTRDNKGHITGVTTSTIPTNPNTDEKVKANTSAGKFYLIGQDDASNGTTETAYKNASVYVDGGYLYSGNAKVLTSYTEQYTGTVTSITPGTGLTNGTTENAITSTGTLNLKIASQNEIGGVKPGVTNGKTYGVQVDASGAMTVNVPWTDNNDNTWRDVWVGGEQKIATGTNSGSLKFVNGTNITATWNSTNKTIQFDASGLATDDEVATAKSEAIEAATIYWETL